MWYAFGSLLILIILRKQSLVNFYLTLIHPKINFHIIGIIFSSGEIWKTHRRFALKVLKDLGMNKSILETKIQEEAEELVAQIKEKVGKCTQEGIDPKMLIVKAVNNVISCLVFGSKCSLDEEFEDKVAKLDAIVQNTPKTSSFLVLLCFEYADIRLIIMTNFQN